MSMWQSYPNPALALVGLRQRARYRPSGIAKPIFAGHALSTACLMLTGGLLFGLLRGGASTSLGEESSELMGFFLGFLLPFAGAVFLSLFGAWTVRLGQVRRPWFMAVISLFWTLAFLAGFLVIDLPNLIRSWDSNFFSFLVGTALYVALLPGIWFTIWMIVCNDVYRVHYPVEGGRFGEQHFLYFRSFSGQQVLQALESGDLPMLSSLRASGPNVGGPAWQNYTVLTLSTCPGHPDQPAYMHLKDVFMAGGPLLSSRIHSSTGFSRLHHVRLEQEDLRRLAWLLPTEVGPIAARMLNTAEVAPAPSFAQPGMAPPAAPYPTASPAGNLPRLPLGFQTTDGNPPHPVPPPSQYVVANAAAYAPTPVPGGLLPPPVAGAVYLGEAQPTGPPKGATPLGLPLGAPPTVSTANGSWYQAVEPGEERRLRLWHLLGTFSFAVAAIAAFLLAGIGAIFLDEKPGEPPGLAEIALIIVFFAMLAISLVLCFSNGWMTRKLLRWAFRGRPRALFPPSAGNMLLGLEDARTYQTAKFLPDDVGLARIGPEGMDIEMSRFRMHLVADDVHLELHESPPHYGLKICCMMNDIPMALTVTEVGKNSIGPDIITHPRDKALRLWRKVYDLLKPGG